MANYCQVRNSLTNTIRNPYFPVLKLHVSRRADIEKLVKNQYVAAMFTRSHSERAVLDVSQ